MPAAVATSLSDCGCFTGFPLTTRPGAVAGAADFLAVFFTAFLATFFGARNSGLGGVIRRDAVRATDYFAADFFAADFFAVFFAAFFTGFFAPFLAIFLAAFFVPFFAAVFCAGGEGGFSGASDPGRSFNPK